MNIIEERDKRNINRRLKKKQYDEIMKLSVSNGGWCPLVQEGMVTYGDGSPWFYIMRGALERYYDQLPSDYEGSINIGHTDMATYPDRIVGKWTRNNLRLADAGDGRKKLETDLPVNAMHPLVQALQQADFDLGLSVEMTTDVNEALTNDRELNPFGIPMVEDLFIWDYAIVGDAGDVNSMGVHLKGGSELQMNDLAKLLAKEGGDNIAEITKLMDAALSEAEEEKPEVELEAETEEEEKVELEAEEETEEKTELEAETEETEEEVEVGLDEPADETTFLSIMQQLAEELKSLREENASLKEQLAAKKKEEADFVAKFKKLSVSLRPAKAPVEERKEVYTDGIGE